MIEVDRAEKTFGTHKALTGVTFRVERGAVVGLLGKNGAGKTTTLRILAGVIRPDRGTVKLDGIDCAEDPLGARRKTGYLPESSPLYPELRVQEHLRFRAAQKGIPRPDRSRQVERALSLAGAWPVRDVRCAHLSRGLRQRVGLADALLAESPILLLDEPTAGLDPTQIRETRDTLRKLSETTTILISTHILAEVDALCDSAILLDCGIVKAQGSVAALRSLSSASELVVTLRATAAQISIALGDCAATIDAIEEIATGIQRIILVCPPGMDVDALAERVTTTALQHGLAIREVQQRAATLEQIFADLTTRKEPRC